MKKILGGIVVALIVIAATFYVTLVSATYGPENCTWQLDLAKVRSLASSLPGEKPKEIRVEEVSGMSLPKALACPGASWDKAQFRVYAYQVVYADKTIVVDTAFSRAQAKDLGMTEGYDDAAWQHVAEALKKASAVYVTHEHADHMGGAFADDQWAGNLRLAAAQLESTVRNRPAMSAAARSAAKRIDYERYQAVAPGVVLIKARGHTPGSQMVYVARADGTEILLTGDTAWLAESIDRQQAPPKFALWMMGSDRNEQACQLLAIHNLDTAVDVMTGHDSTRMKALVEKGVFVHGFR
jgi:glyoxylase-like metal-dependent hydrolase (beta-lactamase superfamily II)